MDKEEKPALPQDQTILEGVDTPTSDTVLDPEPSDKTDEAVDDILKKESEDLLKLEDAKIQNAFDSKTRWDRLKEAWKEWLADPKKRYSTIAGISVALLLLFSIPVSRYFLLNTVGMRASAKVTVLDSVTKLPLKNVKVTIDGKEALTSRDGIASLDKIKLGSKVVNVEKIAYATYSAKTTVGLGGNDLPQVSLEPTGAQYGFTVTDWLSDKAITTAEASFGESSALSDSSGKVLLTIPPTDEEKIDITLTAEGYKEKRVGITTQSESTTSVPMVVGVRHYFVSNRDGKYDLFSALPDGTDEKLVLNGTGLEKDSIRFSVAPNNKYGVLVATREEVRNKDGYLLSGLYVVDLESGEIEKKDESEQIDMVGWADDSIIYIKMAAGSSGSNPERHRLMSHNVESDVEVQLAASNYFNDVLVAQNFIFYAPSSAYKENPEAYLFRVKSDGSDKQTVIDKEVWTIVQTEYDAIEFDVKQVWYKSGVNVLYANKQDDAPDGRSSQLYCDNPNHKTAAWIDDRDGKGVLLLHDVETSEDKDILRRAGVRHPMRWLSDKHLLFRVVSESETADYVVNIEGGDPQKISDVANVPGVDRWYYFY